MSKSDSSLDIDYSGSKSWTLKMNLDLPSGQDRQRQISLNLSFLDFILLTSTQRIPGTISGLFRLSKIQKSFNVHS